MPEWRNGSRGRLRICCRKAWGFESLLGYDVNASVTQRIECYASNVEVAGLNPAGSAAREHEHSGKVRRTTSIASRHNRV